jgi:hypothetical protein
MHYSVPLVKKFLPYEIVGRVCKTYKQLYNKIVKGGLIL